MDQQHVSELFEQGTVLLPRLEIKAVTKPWYSPPAWDGVYLKDLVTGKETGGEFSYHIVRIQQGCEVADHNHDTQWELNMVLSGKGIFKLDDRDIAAKPGQTFATPPGIHHTVSAGDEELSLLALFIPALL
jgi:quercetin dioxygenase-like cupin family protein